MYGSVVVPLDGSPFAEHALPWARAIAARARGDLRLVHVHVPLRIPTCHEVLGERVDSTLRSLRHRHPGVGGGPGPCPGHQRDRRHEVRRRQDDPVAGERALDGSHDERRRPGDLVGEFDRPFATFLADLSDREPERVPPVERPRLDADRGGDRADAATLWVTADGSPWQSGKWLGWRVKQA